jgi:hypothetical protein
LPAPPFRDAMVMMFMRDSPDRPAWRMLGRTRLTKGCRAIRLKLGST